MSKIAMVVDSTANLTQEYIARHEITVVPLYINMDGQVLRDQVDITPDEFYARLPKCKALPSTSQPSAGDFEAAYRALAQAGATTIISCHISSGLSGTVNSAQLAKEQVAGLVQVEVVDTRSASAGHQLVAEAGINALAAGADLPGTLAAMQAVVEANRIVFTVDTLEYLYKGGRIGGAAALIGSLLQFKPMLAIIKGRVEALERVRTEKRALPRMVEITQEWVGAEQPLELVIMQANCAEKSQVVADLIAQSLNVTRLRVADLSPVIGTHGGPGTIGIAVTPSALYGTPA